jgi:hypothetical protein
MTIALDSSDGRTTIEIAVFSSMTLANMAKQIVEKPMPREPLITADSTRAKITKMKIGSDTKPF